MIVDAMKQKDNTIRTVRSNGDKICASAKAGISPSGSKSLYAHRVEMQRMEKMLAM